MTNAEFLNFYSYFWLILQLEAGAEQDATKHRHLSFMTYSFEDFWPMWKYSPLHSTANASESSEKINYGSNLIHLGLVSSKQGVMINDTHRLAFLDIPLTLIVRERLTG